MFKLVYKTAHKLWLNRQVNTQLLTTYHNLAVKLFTKAGLGHKLVAASSQVFQILSHTKLAEITVWGGLKSPNFTATINEATSLK